MFERNYSLIYAIMFILTPLRLPQRISMCVFLDLILPNKKLTTINQ